jgi:serine/threonine protein phosphatase 1
MGDIHGAYKALVQCLHRSGFDYETDTLIQLGDITDRHPQVYECVEELLKIKQLIALKGNHDDWFLQYINTGFHPGSWGHGGRETLMSYLQHSTRSYDTRFLNPGDVPDTHAAFFSRQKHFYISEANDCFVHAGFDRNKDFFADDALNYIWDRSLWQDALAWDATGKYSDAAGVFMKTVFREVYIGHTPTTKLGSDKPRRAVNITNLDTGAGHTGRLTIMNLETKAYWQSDPVTQLYREGARM